ncbi:peptidoglycan DD-metalloendopeptidase family protein [Paenibacillus sp. GCM10027626]|uniref:peptidoglycan DD-metalloendopeptidase family protein n=1 Tax=Paenibacillus sp. GCM10027626 TaxID=3273411 RepID=UPI00363A3AB9
MEDQNKPKLKKEDSPKTMIGETAVKPSAWRKLLSKKWTAPAAFMAAAAIIVTLMWIYRGTEQTPSTTDSNPEVSQVTGEESLDLPVDDTLEVASTNETMQWPVVKHSDYDVAMSHYDATASDEDRAAAMIQTGNTFSPHMGIDLSKADDQPFDVMAALSGTVIVAESHPLNGGVVEIKHADGLVTVYHSLTNVNVKVGDKVKQGKQIAKSGRDELEKELGNHLHFEVRQNGKPVNPNTLLEQ